MKSAEIRQSFIDFFRERDHRLHASAPLVPHDDPTLLFTNAGMVQFKDYFTGAARPPAPRAVSVQKCLRVSGKHNDLENVGPSPRHHTFFEMLGNFSFGEYFKEAAIDYGWELVTGVWGLPPEHLFATVFREDDEAFDLWRRISRLPEERILRCGEKDNFWAMGDTGPCGPCSEIFVDLEPDRPHVDWKEGSEGGRYLEIWNLVFMQFERQEGGGLEPLPNPSIDTGAGLERVAAVLQGVVSNYDSDLFQPILMGAAELAGIDYGADRRSDVAMRVIADHLRAVTFLLADGVIPGNEGRGYVLRRILRRAVRHGMALGFDGPFLHRLVPVLGEVMGACYKELGGTEEGSVATVRAEEEKFLATVATASRQVQEAIETARRDGRDELGGDTVFRLYDTYGLPIDVIREIAEEERIAVDERGFGVALDRQRRRSRSAGADQQQRLAAVQAVQRRAGETPGTDFVGYRQLTVSDARVQAVVDTTGDAPAVAASLAAGGEGVVLLDRTPFYAESGGQVGDRGRLSWAGGEAAVVDVQKDPAGGWYHFVEVQEGSLERAAAVSAEVDRGWRRPTQRNHTATHLLHAALRRVLGGGVRQAGSLVAPDHLRFDFTFHRPLTQEERDRVERLVNLWVLEAREVVITADRSFEEAVEAGAMALFGEKYGDRVRTVEVPGFAPAGPDDELRSLELCGGCHVANSGEIGPIVILAERSIASGVRRIEALSGEPARSWLDGRRRIVNEIAAGLGGVEPERAAGEVRQLRERQRELEKELSDLRLEVVAGGSEEAQVRRVGGIEMVVREVPPAPANELRNMADVLRSRLGSGVVVLGSRGGGKVSLVTAVTADLTERLHAGKLAGRIAALVGGRGGGRPDFAQAGGKRPEELPAALDAVSSIVEETLSGG